jgi:outer membrane protein assembly factor BamB
VASREGRVRAVDRTTGKEAWTYLAEKRIDGSPVIARNRVYVGSYDRNLYVVDLNKGKEVQKILLDGVITASPAISGGFLVIGSDKGTVYGLAAPSS